MGGQLYTKKHAKHESFSGSSSQLTERNLRTLNGSASHSLSKSVNIYQNDDEQSIDSELSYRSQTRDRRHRRAMASERRERQQQNGSFDDGNDASQMVVQMMETKIKNLQNSLKIERT